MYSYSTVQSPPYKLVCTLLQLEQIIKSQFFMFLDVVECFALVCYVVLGYSLPRVVLLKACYEWQWRDMNLELMTSHLASLHREFCTP